MFVVQKRRKQWSIFLFQSDCFICKAYAFLSTENVHFIISNYVEVLVSSWLLLFHGQIFWSVFIPPIETYVSEFECSLLLKSKAFCKTCRRKRLFLIISIYFKCFSSSFFVPKMTNDLAYKSWNEFVLLLILQGFVETPEVQMCVYDASIITSHFFSMVMLSEKVLEVKDGEARLYL